MILSYEDTVAYRERDRFPITLWRVAVRLEPVVACRILPFPLLL
jgi:hypothetical protein